MKIKNLSDARVVITLREPTICSTPDEWKKIQRKEALDLITQIERHVDGLGTSFGHVPPRFEYDTQEICEFCWCAWEEDETGPLCCLAAQEEHNAEAPNQG